MKRIFKNREYKVEKVTDTEISDYGTLLGDDVHLILKGCKYDADLDMYFTKGATIGYAVTEIK